MRKHLPDRQLLLNKTVDGDYKLVEFIASGCNGHVFRGYSENLRASAAYKIIPSENLAEGENWKIEAQKANSLENVSVVRCDSFIDLRSSDGYIVLKYEYVDGTSLKEYIKAKGQITVPFVFTFLRTMLDLFFEMQARNIQHGDFHSGNILVTKPSQFQRNPTESFKVTDFGIGGVTSGASQLDDFEQLGCVLAELLGRIDYQYLSPEDKYSFNVLGDHFVSKHLKERDITLDPIARNPDKLIARLDEIGRDYALAMQGAVNSTLQTPFDYLSCEQIGQDHSLLHALYSEKFLGISEIESANNLVVTGPRGCGKSTVFRSLSLKHQIIVNKTVQLDSVRYIGIYYHCHDLYLKFPRYQLPERIDAIDLPIHYLTCALLIEILDTILLMLKRQATSVGTQENLASAELWKLLGIKRPALPNSDSFSSLVAALNKECQWTIEKYQFTKTGSQPIKPLFGPGKLLECCSILRERISDLDNKPFFCFIDDYSIPHISHHLQRSLNRLLMQRNEYCFFKMATESPVSFAVSDIDDKFYAEGREFEVLNLGLKYLTEESEDRKLEFLDDVFSRRLRAVDGYPVTTLVELVGEGDGLNFTELAEKIATGEKPPEWSGRITLSRMCSGDIHQLITIVRKMVADSGGVDGLRVTESSPRIEAKMQNKAIRGHAGNFLQSVADSGAHGERLRKIVSAFGNIANSFIKYKLSKNEKRTTRYQASRIELHEVPILEGAAKEIYEELLRYSVFIQDPRGKSIRGNVVPRLYLRRFLVPHFNLTFSLRDSVRMNESDFRELLTDPEGFEKSKRLWRESANEPPQIQQKLDFAAGAEDD